MSQKVYVAPEDIMDFFDSSRSRLSKELVLVAEDTETCHQVYVTNENDRVSFEVWCGKDLIESSNTTPVIEEYTDLLESYIFTDHVQYESDTDLEQEEVLTREDDLICAVDDFLAVLLDDPYRSRLDYSSIIEDVLNDICWTISDNYDIEIYRPRLEEGELVEFPYIQNGGI